METKLNYLKEKENEFFRFMREKHPIFYNSNIFLRDIQYSIFTYFDLKGDKLQYSDAEIITNQFTDYLVNQNKLIKLSHNTWRVNFTIEEFVKPQEIKEETEEVSQ